MKKIAVAIDGPAGAGKSTVAKALAKRLGYVYLDTGSMYRALTCELLHRGVPVDREEKVCSVVQNLTVEVKNDQEELIVMVNDRDVSAHIRRPEVSACVSQVAAYACVRQHLVKEQQRLAENGGIVMDGRDIGTVVLPHAELKVFLTASVEERARRRLVQWNENHPDEPQTMAQIVQNIQERDRKDTERAISPLRQAEDAILLDTTSLTQEETIDRLTAMVKKVTA
ncbi:(d)CMP kinase [Negativicoccus succinicivorans]|uniref:(d)CMP kinase n=1 Tax=Negativicoccus succinicivorans TaxID=620903 RepID=UPI00290BB5B9|nr:(d)CMP kinase [Negativicoccus succinicivorans]MDU5530225.1 (d)CMP kinase [Negativicoccus succinicivorans]